MYCEKCGHEMSEHAKFCPNCGAPNKNYVPKDNTGNSDVPKKQAMPEQQKPASAPKQDETKQINKPEKTAASKIQSTGSTGSFGNTPQPETLKKQSKIVPIIAGIVVVVIVLAIGIGNGSASGKNDNAEATASSSSEEKEKTESTPTATPVVTEKPTTTPKATTAATKEPTPQPTETASSSEPVSTNGQQDIQIIDSGYHIVAPNQYSSTCYIYYAAKIKNPNTNLIASFPDLIATAKAEDGTILGSSEQMGYYIMPNDTVVLASQMDAGTSVPATVEFSVTAQDYTSSTSTAQPSSADYTIENVSEVQSDFGPKVTGQVTYSGTGECDMIGLTALFLKDGKIVDSAIDFVNNPVAGTPSSFEITPTSSDVPDHDSVEVYAQNG